MVEFQCPMCHWIVIEPEPYRTGQPCMHCRRSAIPHKEGPPSHPPMRSISSARANGIGFHIAALVFAAGIAVGYKMAGG